MAFFTDCSFFYRPVCFGFLFWIIAGFIIGPTAFLYAFWTLSWFAFVMVWCDGDASGTWIEGGISALCCRWASCLLLTAWVAVVPKPFEEAGV